MSSNMMIISLSRALSMSAHGGRESKTAERASRAGPELSHHLCGPCFVAGSLFTKARARARPRVCACVRAHCRSRCSSSSSSPSPAARLGESRKRYAVADSFASLGGGRGRKQSHTNSKRTRFQVLYRRQLLPLPFIHLIQSSSSLRVFILTQFSSSSTIVAAAAAAKVRLQA